MDEPAWAKGRPKAPAWRSGPVSVVYENPWIRIEASDATAPTGRPAKYAVVRFANLAVGVVPLWPDGTVTLVGQQRFALGDYSWELPEGGAPLDEDPLEGGKRELREEVGLEAADWREILRLQLSNSVTDERAVVYLATGFTRAAINPDETEALDVVRVPFRDLLAEVLACRVQDAMTVAAAFRLHHMAVTGELDDDLARAVLGS
jgi:8-oxo-dGTP pyrophosphatase MutT (NUDIX family)